MAKRFPMKSHENSFLRQSHAQFQSALSEGARVLFTDPLSDNTKQSQTRLLVAPTLLLVVSLSIVRITNAKFPFVETTISINGKSMGIVIAVLTACFLFSFAAQAILELKARSVLSDQFFLSRKELLDFHSKTVSQSFALDDEMREIWALEGPILTHYRLTDSYQNERLFRLVRNAPPASRAKKRV